MVRRHQWGDRRYLRLAEQKTRRLRGAAALVEPCEGVCLSHSYRSCVSALARSIRNLAIFSLPASTYRRPFSDVAAAGLPTPVSSVTWRHCRGAHAHPSRSPAILKRRALPDPASASGRTNSGATWSITLVSSSPAWSPVSAKNWPGSSTLYQLTTHRNDDTAGCSSRIIWRKSLPPCPFRMTSLGIP